jgi:gluconolactonase
LYACGSTDTPPTEAGGSSNAASGGSAGKASGSGGTGAGGMTAAGGSVASGGATTGGAGGTTGGTGTGGGAGHGGTTTTGGAGGAGGSSGGSSGTAGMPASGGATSTGGAPSGGMSAGGGAGLGSGGTAGAAQGGAAGSGGSAGTSTTGGWKCPSGVTTTPMLTGTPTRIASVPPKDAFNQNNGTFGNVEGPVWIGDALYMSEMASDAYDSMNGNVKKSRILKVTSDGTTSIFIADSGSNGMAVDADGNIVAAVHKDGSITRFALPGGAPTPIVSMYNGNRFDSPNDLAIHSNGTLYFSDPSFQAPNTPPQPQTLAYRVAPGSSTAVPIPSAASPDMLSNPNGVTLSLAEDYLYISADTGKRYPVMADGTLGAGENFAAINGGDGMTIDCAGNLYVAKANTATVVVYKPDGTMLGTITVPDVQAATNVAFGGADHQTLYITGLGNNKGLFKLSLNLPGKPY